MGAAAPTKLARMELRADLITLAVPDLEAANRYYVDALACEPVFQVPGEVTFLRTGIGSMLALFSRADLAKDIGTDDPPAFALGHNCASEADVDTVVATMRDAGATVLKEPQKAFWGGYHGYLRAPDGTVWEVAYNSNWSLEAGDFIDLS
jgi:catechol 2,3-dioxygenase-like lactoylglutathione lyase family enzyme